MYYTVELNQFYFLLLQEAQDIQKIKVYNIYMDLHSHAQRQNDLQNVYFGRINIRGLGSTESSIFESEKHVII